ncbi:sugar phosphate nucleotidyltransferase [Halorarius litoreus]|uniref:sugar phosphate nucleotidyltransferase n=1 Tax=Halorarius litoreus TaxID=2962676 RepID=UPI0020CEF6F0|nr:sugar phosphate nucleotidyltransferase [Halorarius litoreus]
MNVTTGVVLAAGEGTRLRPLTRNRPKPMLPAGNRPIIEYVLDALLDAGLDEIVLVVGYRSARVQEHFGPTYRDVPLTYVHQDKQLGSGHALLQAREVVDGPFVAVNGDRVVDPEDVASVVEAFDGETAIAVREHPNASKYGAVRVSGDRLTELVEKPTSDDYRLINAGIYAFSPAIFDVLAGTEREDGTLFLPNAVASQLTDTDVTAVRTSGIWVDATYPWDLLAVARELLSKGWIDEPQRGPGVHVDPTARVHEDATLQGPVVVGADVEIAAGAVVGPDVALGRNATVEANATIEGSVVDADTRVGPGATLLDCVTGQHATIGPNALVPGGPSDVRVGQRVFPDQRLGAVVADRAELGGGAVCEPGTLVGANALVGAGAYARGRVPEDAEVVR